MQENPGQNNDPFVLVHIPKTAGTSLHMAMKVRFGTEAMVYDYGADSPVTVEMVKRHVYRDKDPDAFAAAVRKIPGRVVCGHIRATKYLDQFGVGRTLLFLRDPIKRLVSEYIHLVEYDNYTGSLADFYHEPRFTNRQASYVAGVDLEDFAFVGITERYAEAVPMLNRQFGWKLSALALNKSKSVLDRESLLAEVDLGELRGRNEEDIELYERGVALFERRNGE